MAERVEIKIVVNKQTGAISIAGQELKGLGEQAEGARRRLDSLSGGANSLAGALTGLVSIAAVGEFFRSSIRAAIEQEDALNRLNAALEANGNLTAEASRQAEAFATQMQATTRFGDDAVLSAQALLASFGLAGDELNRATRAAADLSAVFGKDLQTSAQLLARAMAGQTESLSRYGITVNSSIPASQQFDAILRQINDRFGGRAQADVRTFGGALAQLRNVFSDLQEEIGGQLIPILTDMGRAFTANLDRIRDFFSGVLFAVRSLVAGVENGARVLSTTIAGLVDNAVSGLRMVVLAFQRNFAGIEKAQEELAQRNKARLDALVADSQAAADKLSKAFDETIGRRVSGETAAQAGMTAAAGRGRAARRALTEAEIREAEEAAKKRLKAIETDLNTELARKNVASSKRLDLIRTAEEQELAVIQDLRGRGVISAQEFELRREQMAREFAQRRTAIEQQHIEDVVAANEAWAAKIGDLNARTAETGRQAFDAVGNAVGTSFARSITQGKDFSKSFTDLWRQIKEQVIAQITAMLVKLAALKVAMAVFGPKAGVITKLLATGGRVPGLKKVRALQGGGRTSGPELALIGEGNDRETVVPDRQAPLFAMGVQAGARARAAGAAQAETQPGTEAVPRVVNATINVTVNAVNMQDAAQVRSVARGLADLILQETEEGIRLSRRVVEAAERYPGRAT